MITTNTPKKRQMIHHRKINITGFQLDTGSFEIEGKLHDIRGHDMNLEDRGGLFPAGEPLHVMTLNLFINDQMLITEAKAITHSSPFNLCKSVNDNYLGLVGITIGPGWTHKIKEILGKAQGCTHLNEMLAQMATVAFQTVWGSKPASEEILDPRVINSCYGYQEKGEVVLRYLKNTTK